MDEILDDDDANFMSDWSGSMTPPVSDAEDDILVSQCVAPPRKEIQNQVNSPLGDDDTIPIFECKDPSSGFTNVPRQKLFQRIKEKKKPYANCACFQGSTVRLFGMKFPTAEGLYQNYRRKLFLLCRQSIFRLKGVGRNPGNLNTDQYYRCIKSNCVDFMAYVHCLLHRNIAMEKTLPAILDYNNVVESTINEFNLLLMAIGRIQIQSPLRDLTDNALQNFNKANIDELMNHTILEINWFYLIILMELCLNDDVNNEKKATYITKFENHCTKIIWDLLSIAYKVFIKNRSATLSRPRSSLFPCTCCLEMMMSVVKMADEVSFHNDSQGFWALFTSICSSLQIASDKSAVERDNPASLVPENSHFDEPVPFIWWLLKGIAPLYKHDVAGRIVYKEGMFLPCNWLLVQDLLRETFKPKGPDTDEEYARECVRSCLELAKLWNPNVDIITALWEYYHRRFNAKFSVGNQGILNTALPRLTALQLMEKYSFDKTGNLPERISPDIPSSFELFLRFLAISLLKPKKIDESTNLWVQLKGRFYSKFHSKRMGELNEIGLQNFIGCFLVLANCVEPEDIIEKFCIFLSLMQPETMSNSRVIATIKGLYAMHHVERKCKVSSPVLKEKLKSNFESICRNFTERHHDQLARRNNWQLISLHFDCIEELFDSNDSAVEEAPILNLGDALSNVFNNCNDSEARRIASFVYRLLSSSRSHDKTNSSSHSFIWSALYPWMQKSTLDKQLLQRIPESIADPAAGFTLLSIHRNEESTFIPAFTELLKKYTAFELPVRFSSKFLSHLLSSSTAFDKIISENLQPHVIQTWLHCLIFLTDKDQVLSEIARHILLLPEVKAIIEKENKSNKIEAENIIFTLIVALGKGQTKAVQLSELVALRQKANAYFGSILRNTESLLQTGIPTDPLRFLYSVVSKLVKHCPKLIYAKTSPDCLLPKILDQMVLPHKSAKKTIPAVVNNCLYGHIHQFLQGLSALDFKKDEFIRRKVKEIFNRYFLLIIKRCHTSPTSKNPFLVALQTTFAKEPSSYASDFRQYIIEIIAENFLVLPQPPDNHSAVLYFIARLFQKTHSNAEIVRNSPSIIMQTMCSLISCDACGGANSEPPGIRRPAMEILTVITRAYKPASKEERAKLLESLEKVMQLNINQFQGVVFKSFEAIANLDKQLAKELISTATKTVDDSEKRRGCGKDNRLRNSLDTFIACVGD